MPKLKFAGGNVFSVNLHAVLGGFLPGSIHLLPPAAALGNLVKDLRSKFIFLTEQPNPLLDESFGRPP